MAGGASTVKVMLVAIGSRYDGVGIAESALIVSAVEPLGNVGLTIPVG
jgi:hypothetical protein